MNRTLEVPENISLGSQAIIAIMFRVHWVSNYGKAEKTMSTPVHRDTQARGVWSNYGIAQRKTVRTL
jgi:hypothetical protein